MPPSPSLRRSPARELQTDSHRRGRSLESGLSFKEKDDDLALFNEMQSKESDNFLLQPTDDFEDILSSKYKPFSDFKLAINIPVRGESSDLLNAEVDKNDYDWLLTPPDTPLFPSLDNEPTPVNLVHSGRPRSRPISISRSSTMEKSHRSIRGSPSPQRLSPSPQSGNSVFQPQPRGRPSSAPHSSPRPIVRSRTPPRRTSPPPIKPSTPQPRSSTPTSRRISTGSSVPVSSSLRGTSPVRASRGNSPSPKIKAWQSNIPGFSSEAPPNLRTSLADRPASYVRGSSPASRNSRDSSSKFSRQSLSPTTSRSISSSHSHERDRFSSHSKGSVASSGDDDADSLHSISTSVTDRSLARRGGGGLPRNRPLAFSKKPTKTFSPSSAPKRSFDSAIRQMDRKSPQNMFRPLLSSVPSSTFYSGKPSSTHHAIPSRNSSVTTSSNAGSDHGTGGGHDTEGSEQNQDDMTSDCQRTTSPDIHNELFALGKMEVAGEDSEHETHKRFPDVQSIRFACESTSDNSEGGAALATIAMPDALDVDSYVKVDCPENTNICFRCGCRYYVIGVVECEVNVCPDCKQEDGLFEVPPETINNDAMRLALPVVRSTEEQGSPNATKSLTVAPELPEILDMGGSSSMQCASNDNKASESQTLLVESKGSCILDKSLPPLAGEENTPSSASHPAVSDPSVVDSEDNRLHKFHCNSKPNGDVGEAAGISVLLKRSSSCKGPLIQGRNVTAAAISLDEPYYAKTLTSSISMRSSIGHGSTSTSLSNDLSSRRVEMLVQRQLSHRRFDNSSKPQSTITSFSGTSAYGSQDLCPVVGSQEENFEVSGSTNGHNLGGEPPAAAFSESVAAVANMKLLEEHTSFSGTSLSKEETCRGDMSSSINDNSSLYVNAIHDQLEDHCRESSAVGEDHVFHATDVDSQNNGNCVADKEESVVTPDSIYLEENAILDRTVDEMDATEDPLLGISVIVSESEDMDHHLRASAAEKEADCDSRDELKESRGLPMSDEDAKDSASQAINSNYKHQIVEESTVMVEGQGGRMGRNLTLEQATDTILLCSSIVHNLACDAASIAIEKENENLAPPPLEGSKPTVTIVGKTTSDRQRGRRTSKRTAKSQKIRQQRHVETDTRNPSIDATEPDDRAGCEPEPVTRNVGIPNKTDGTEPPKLESKCNCTIM